MTKIWIVSVYGANVFNKCACGINEICGVEASGLPPPLSVIATYSALGFAITFALGILHSRFIWFPFEPLGFVIATSIGGLNWAVWSTLFGAWIVKTIVLRVGGSKLYERCVPIVGGFLAGVTITIFAVSLILVLRFFVPF